MLTFKLLKSYGLPKRGNAESEYEDDFRTSTDRYAIADGATESSFAKTWAGSLVQQFIERPPELSELEEWLRPLQERWQREIDEKTLSWFAAEKARYGAFSTLLGLEFQNGSQWWALSVGDSNLFLIRGGCVETSFPLTNASEFGISPILISSNPTRNHAVWASASELNGAVCEGDLFLLTTDALAHWFLSECEAGEQPWKQLITQDTSEQFAEFIDDLRARGRIRNDDVTLLAIRVESVEAAFT